MIYSRYIYIIIALIMLIDFDDMLISIFPQLSLYTKDVILFKYTIVICMGLYIFFDKKKISPTFVYNLILVFLFFSFLCLRDFIQFGEFNSVFATKIFFIIVASLLLKEFSSIYNFDFFLLISLSVSLLALIMLSSITYQYGWHIVDIVTMNSLKKLTSLGYVNAFSYVCSFGIVCGIVAWKNNHINEFPRNIYYFYYSLLFIFPVIYLMAAKSKGAIMAAILGISVLAIMSKKIGVYVRWLFLFGLCGLLIVSLVCQACILSIFYDVMMYGRNAAENQVHDKVLMMFKSRFYASEFIKQPIEFLISHPFGVGIKATLARTYEIPLKDTIIHIHSLFVIFIEAYGFLAIIGMPLLLWQLSKNAAMENIVLGMAILAIPFVFTNNINSVFAVGLTMMMLKRYQNSLNGYDEE